MGFTTPCFIRKNTPELRKKLGKLGYKKNSPNWTDDCNIIWTYQYTRYKNGKSIIKYDCNGNFIEEYINITSAAKENKICITSITNCAKGRSKTAGGFKWEYKHV